MKKFILALTAAMAFSLLSAQPSFAAGNEVWLRAGGAGQNSWSYSCMVAVAESIKKSDPGLEIVIQATPGSTTHYGMFDKKSLDVGTGYTPTDYWANNGIPPVFKQSFAGKFYTIAPMTISKTHILVRKDSSIKTLSDLNGKTIYAGDQGAASTQLALSLIKSLNIQGRIVQTDRSEGFEMLKEGRVDALIQSQGAPYAAILELATATDLRFIPFSEAELKKCTDEGPYCFAGAILPTEYSFVTEPIPTLTQVQNINVRATLEDETVYRLTKAIVEAWPMVVNTVAAAGRVDPMKDVTKTVVKIHPGAIRYYEEKGVTIPAELRP